MQSFFVPSFVAALIAAFLTSFATPWVQHHFWRQQKLREQKLLLTEHLAALGPKIVLLYQPNVELTAWNTIVGELDAVLYGCQVLFELSAREACSKLHALLRFWQWSPRGAYDTKQAEQAVREMHQAYADTLAALYAEVFSKKTEKNWFNPYYETENSPGKGSVSRG